MIRRVVPVLVIASVVALGLMISSCASAAPTAGNTAGTPTPTLPATPQPTKGHGSPFSSKDGCQPDIRFNGSAIVLAPHATLTIYNSGQPVSDCDFGDKLTPGAIRELADQSKRGGGSTDLSPGAVFFVHTDGSSSQAAPAAGAGYYAKVQILPAPSPSCATPTADATATATSTQGTNGIVIRFDTYSPDGSKSFSGNAMLQAPSISSHVTVSLASGGGVSLIDGSKSTTATPTTTP
jgi:hypothetical protein